MSSSTNVRLVKEVYEAMDRGDMPAMLGHLDAEFVLWAPESLPYGGTFHGPEGFRAFLGKLIALPLEFPGREPREFLDAGDRIVVPLRFFARRKEKAGETIAVPEVHIWTLRRDKIVGLEAYPDTATVLRALQS